MAKLLPFQRTGALISEIDEFLDKVAEAVMVLEQTIRQYVESGDREQLEARFEQIRSIEDRADEIRRAIANVMYTEMLMPDTRGDVLSLLDEVDGVLDHCSHIVAGLVIERPDLDAEVRDSLAAITSEAVKAAQAMLSGARAYFKEPHAVRDHVHKAGFHNKEATTIGLRAGKAVYDSDLPLDRKQQLVGWLVAFRQLASNAEDIGEQVAIFAIKRSF